VLSNKLRLIHAAGFVQTRQSSQVEAAIPTSDQIPRATETYGIRSRNLLRLSAVLFLLHTFLMLYRYGQIPIAPVIGDEVIINEPAVALSRGQGLISPGFRDSAFGLDKLYAHFPPVYIFAESLAFRALGVSVYSLRLVTTVMGVASAGLFLLLMWCICRWNLADWGLASIAACLYTLNPTMLVLHRLARMESMVECLTLGSLLCLLTGIYSKTENPSADGKSQSLTNGDKNRRLLFLLAGAVLAGVSLVTHPEALMAVLPIVLLILLAAPVSWRNRIFLLIVLGLTPVAIWFGTYGARWKQALIEMGAIHRYAAPPAGIVSFARDFSLETHRNINQGMRATLFLLCLLILGSIVARWVMLKRTEKVWSQSADEIGSKQLLLTGIFASSAILSLIPLAWFMAASVTRYQVIFPIYLAGLVISARGISPKKPVVRWIGAMAAVLILTQLGAMAIYFQKDDDPRMDYSATRFDAIVDSIPPHSRVAVTLMLWLAFQHKGRPVTLLYDHFDGKQKWLATGSNPLEQFDAIVVDSSFVDEFAIYSPYAAQGRKKQTFLIGNDTVNLYQR